MRKSADKGRAYRRGMARTAALSGAVVLAIGGMAGVAINQARTARLAEKRATDQEQVATERLSRSYVDTGMRLLEHGDAGGALAPLVEAMALDQKDAERMRNASNALRVRIIPRASPGSNVVYK